MIDGKQELDAVGPRADGVGTEAADLSIHRAGQRATGCYLAEIPST